jgi:hypothetical protein
MIASFFRSLETRGVGYLLISGQATVLYGAATFSEDIDLWVEPSPENIERLRGALSAARAQYYKLTPPLDPLYFDAGHGFHFLLGESTDEAIFLDIMGRPPRVSSFAAALRASRQFSTDWGTLPTLGIRDLIELKKTQRLADYPIISALTLRLLDESAPSPEMLAWAARHLFTTETFFPSSQATRPGSRRPRKTRRFLSRKSRAGRSKIFPRRLWRRQRAGWLRRWLAINSPIASTGVASSTNCGNCGATAT